MAEVQENEKGYPSKTSLLKNESWIKKLKDSENINRIIVVLLFIIVVILAFHVIQSAAIILVPITFAWLLNTLFHPIVQFGKRHKIPSALSAGLIMSVLVCGFVGLASIVVEPATLWIRELPEILHQLRIKLGSIAGPLSDIKAVTDEIGELAKLDGNLTGNNGSSAIAVQIEEETFAQSFLVDQFPVILTYIAIIVFLTYFLLASGNQFLHKIIQLAPNESAKVRIIDTSQHIRKGVTRYLATVSVINVTLSFVVTAAMYLLDIPNPILWGVLAGVLNFAPYIGPALTLGILTLVGLSEFSTLSNALAVPLTFFFITVIEGQLITPMIVGRSLALSPAGVFLSVVVWGWIWGIPGALMAVPIVASLKIIFENIPSLERIATMLERIR